MARWPEFWLLFVPMILVSQTAAEEPLQVRVLSWNIHHGVASDHRAIFAILEIRE